MATNSHLAFWDSPSQVLPPCSVAPTLQPIQWPLSRAQTWQIRSSTPQSSTWCSSSRIWQTPSPLWHCHATVQTSPAATAVSLKLGAHQISNFPVVRSMNESEMVCRFFPAFAHDVQHERVDQGASASAVESISQLYTIAWRDEGGISYAKRLVQLLKFLEHRRPYPSCLSRPLPQIIQLRLR